MKFLWLLLLSSIMIGADELDFLDEIDKDESTFVEEKSSVDIRSKLNFQINDDQDDDTIFFLQLGKQGQNYVYDVRFIADKDSQSINVKELYYHDKFADFLFYEIGRINIKEGVSRGFNPTDYFKVTHSLTLSNDPKERKENRLGALLASGTLFLDTFIIKGIYSPKISVDKGIILSDSKYVGLYFDESNYHNRASLYMDYSGFKDVSSSLILHLNEDDFNFGLNLSYISGSWIFYLENSLMHAKDKITKVIERNSLHPLVKQTFLKAKEYIDQATLGFNYTSESNIVTTVEYIYNSGGLDSGDWNEWFEMGKNQNFAGQLGLIRAEVAKDESLMSQQSLFVLSRASDVSTNLDASFLAWVNPFDGSTLSQVGLEYAYHNSVQTNLFLRNYQGSKKSEYGSSLNDFELLIEAEYFF